MIFGFFILIFGIYSHPVVEMESQVPYSMNHTQSIYELYSDKSTANVLLPEKRSWWIANRIGRLQNAC